MSCKGLFYTWDNKRDPGGTIVSIIDRVLQKDMWEQDLPDSEAVTLTAGLSDHHPSVGTINLQNRQGPRPFKFFDFWMKNENFQAILQNSWDLECAGSKVYRLHLKPKRLKPDLKALNRKHRSRTFERFMLAKEELSEVQKVIHKGELMRKLQVNKWTRD